MFDGTPRPVIQGTPRTELVNPGLNYPGIQQALNMGGGLQVYLNREGTMGDARTVLVDKHGVIGQGVALNLGEALVLADQSALNWLESRVDYHRPTVQQPYLEIGVGTMLDNLVARNGKILVHNEEGQTVVRLVEHRQVIATARANSFSEAIVQISTDDAI